mmetsp:Transcript_59666/g.96558  ORF Transcript_59666/g.96558 Transcript_59666/m.96558 type:complete len:230 (+) Transcript_59666:202-891(+)
MSFLIHGRMTPPRMCMIPLAISTSALLITALFIMTPFTPFLIVTGPPRVSTVWFLKPFATMAPGRTCIFRMVTRSGWARTASAVSPAASKALSSGANSVKGPSPSRAEVRPAFSKPAMRIEKDDGPALPTVTEKGPEEQGSCSLNFRGLAARLTSPCRPALRLPAATPSAAAAAPSTQTPAVLVPKEGSLRLDCCELELVPRLDTLRPVDRPARPPPTAVKAVYTVEVP